MSWPAEDLLLLEAARELQIAVENGSGSPQAWVPIWVVCTEASTQVTADGDAAYRDKYVGGAGSMLTPEAAATTLRLIRE